ncbi:MAG: hypothetical protein PHR47_02170 [Candidatus Pacebacteria bacterium]|nr:hypothetical protein [Candidatus Paceibacterota bacterium]
MISSNENNDIEPLEEDELEEKKIVEEEEEEFTPVSEADILERERMIEEKKKLLNPVANNPVTNFVNSFLKKSNVKKKESEEIVASEQLIPEKKEIEKKEVPIKTEKDEIDELVAIALSKGIEKASQLAKHKSPYIIDAFHDRLIEEIKKQKTEE